MLHKTRCRKYKIDYQNQEIRYKYQALCKKRHLLIVYPPKLLLCNDIPYIRDVPPQIVYGPMKQKTLK